MKQDESIELNTIGVNHLFLKSTNDHFIWTKPVMSLDNIITENPSLDHYGEMNFTNLTTHETAVLYLNRISNKNKEINGIKKKQLFSEFRIFLRLHKKFKGQNYVNSKC